MLLKLIKYELKSTYGKFLASFAVFIIVCMVAPLLMSVWLPFWSLLFAIAAIVIGILTLSILTFVFIIQRYSSNLYGPEGYLMFTLPVSGKKLLLSKLISGFIWMLIAFMLMVPAYVIIIYIASSAPEFSKFISTVRSLKVNWVLYAIEYIANLAVSVLSIYFSVSMSKLPVWHKFGTPMGFVIYFGLNIVESIPAWMTMNAGDFIKHTAEVSAKSSSASDSFMQGYIMGFNFSSKDFVGLISDIVFFAILFFATSYLLEKKVSLK